MKIVLLPVAVCVLALIFSSCMTEPPEIQFVRQKIPIEILSGKPITIEIHSLSGNEMNNIGIRCPQEVWNVLSNGTKPIAVQLKSSNNSGTELGEMNPGWQGTFLDLIPNVHYLFAIFGRHGAKASVEITFPNAPPGVTKADIIVGKTAIDTKFPNFGFAPVMGPERPSGTFGHWIRRQRPFPAADGDRVFLGKYEPAVV